VPVPCRSSGKTFKFTALFDISCNTPNMKYQELLENSRPQAL